MDKNHKITSWISFLLLALILMVGAYFRFTGIRWDASYHLHPDERFLTMVATSIRPVQSFREYFNTSVSSLNPHNVLDANGNPVYPFFVYGTLPLFLVRYVAEWLSQASYGQIHILGRYLSGFFDLGTILLVFFIARELFNKKWLPFLAAFLYACAVLPIQISHFFIVDHFATFFSMWAFYFAIKIQKQESPADIEEDGDRSWMWFFTKWDGFKYYGLFAVALGMAAASKINTLFVAGALPLAVLVKNYGLFKEKPNSQEAKGILHHLFFAGVLSFFIFRVFQPYAFNGPGFFSLSLNSKWILNLKELGYLSSGSSNYPPSLQWARRSIFFPISNLVVWGMGIPFGVTALLGLVGMGFEIIRHGNKNVILLWFWNLIYFLWQITRWNPTMRYFLPIYPTFSISAAWFVFYLTERIKAGIQVKNLTKIASVMLLVVLGLSAFLWGFAFVNIYREPMTRIAASEWIYHHVEGAINLIMLDDQGEYLQALPYPHQFQLGAGQTLNVQYHPNSEGIISQIVFDQIMLDDEPHGLEEINVSISRGDNDEVLLSSNLSRAVYDGNAGDGSYVLEDFTPFEVQPGQEFQLKVENLSSGQALRFSGNISLTISQGTVNFNQALFEAGAAIQSGGNHEIFFSPYQDGTLQSIEIFRFLEVNGQNIESDILVEVVDSTSQDRVGFASGTLKPDVSKIDYRGSSLVLDLEEPLLLEEGKTYVLRLSIPDGQNARYVITGSKTAKESDWDDALPVSMYGLDPFSSYDGIHYSDLNFQMYWDDNIEKLQRFISILDEADYIVITSSRQWGSTTQIPERYPLTEHFYRELIGCPLDDVQYCYEVGQPGEYSENLGFRLVKTFQVNPKIFSFEFNSQFAEEAFTVYDHPKVFVFEKQDSFEISKVIETLGEVNLDEVLNLSPQEADQRPGKLLLPQTLFEKQKEQGTWSELFDYQSFQNRYPALTILIWYLALSIFGWMVFPTVRLAFSGLADRGYALSKPFGLLLLAFLVWLLSSLGIAFSKWLILFVCGLVAIGNVYLLLKDKNSITAEIKENKKHILWVEIFTLGFFLLFLLIRLGNPDLWHPYKGGEKPMDFAYFNAVIKSAQFPPYDPWYAGGYINYYYFGFVLAAIPTKLLGIVPSIAYNLVLPSFFAYTAMAAFSIGLSLTTSLSKGVSRPKNKKWIQGQPEKVYLQALVVSILVLIVGNLGTLRMIFEGFLRIGSESAPFVDSSSSINQISYFINGIRLFFQGERFNYYPGDWYWIPSRAIPGEPITEFPFFTFLYGDPHAHLFSYPITLVALNWIIGLLLLRKRENFRYFPLSLLAGSVVIGMLRPTNTWDYPIFLGLACISIFYYAYQHEYRDVKIFPYVSGNLRKIVICIGYVLGFVGATLLFFMPFGKWYGGAYTSLSLWEGNKTPISSYLMHWGFFLFIISSWTLIEFRNWLASTPLSALKPYYPHRKTLIGIVTIIFLLTISLYVWGVKMILIIAPLVLIGLLLLLRKGTNPVMRISVLMMVVGLCLTFLVEVIVLKGDIGRMNTVFKFYLQAWTFLSISSGIFLIDLQNNLRKKISASWRTAWRISFVLLLVSVLLFPLVASFDKITDRMSAETPLTMDGMEFMRYATYVENDYPMDLNQDYAAIRWMQENVQGTPVILEANVPEYRWGNRYAIYTGLPAVIGWNWHQRQQRAINPGEWVFERINDVEVFYSTDDVEVAKKVLEEYDVGYFVVGQLERAVYAESGLSKFSNVGNNLWHPVFKYGETVIYEVNQTSS